MSIAATKFGDRGWGRGSRHRRVSSHDPDPVLLGGPTVQTRRVPRHQSGHPTHMADAGKSLRDPCVLRRAGGSPHPIFNFRGASAIACPSDHSWDPR
ncbi:hypothetical protein E2C01_071331 [Portunus trituberculatus]|uniref:Uncharacterized protein n=1 Tax=Portunus trituberculatus TaxID=210409 RepID=A0A5B7I4P8_PORTR|nr:hypothetical protein [Portunus trituberculatus]